MGTRVLSLELPDEIVALLGSPERAASRARETLVLDLLRSGELSQGKAAQILNMTRAEVLTMMAQHEIPSGPETGEELRREVEDLEALLQGGANDAGGQRQ